VHLQGRACCQSCVQGVPLGSPLLVTHCIASHALCGGAIHWLAIDSLLPPSHSVMSPQVVVFFFNHDATKSKLANKNNLWHHVSAGLCECET